MRRALLVVVVLLGAVLLAVPAQAENAAQVAAALRTSPVFQESGVDLVDVSALAGELDGTDPQVYVAALSGRAAGSDVQARSRAADIGEALNDDDAVILVLTDNKHVGAATGPGAADRGVNAREALADVRSEAGGFSKGELTTLVTSFAQEVANQAGDGASGGGGDEGGGNGGKLLLVLAALGGGGALLAVRSSRRRKARLNEGLRAEVEQLYNRLGADVSGLDPKDDVVARQALADAAERYNACGAILASADTPAEFAAARRTAIEGLMAAREARTRLGLPLGPELPALPTSGVHLESDTRIQVGDEEYEGSPTYQPGRGHYYEGGYVGGRQVPGGWYSAPFWAPFLLGSVLSGGFGGGGIFGDSGGFERGYEAGQDDAGEDSGGDWGGGGGDWGSGGGDWGGGGDGGGGGDW